MQHLQTYWPLYPELVLIVGAMALLMLGVFRPETDNEAELNGWLAIGVMAVAGWMLVTQPAGTQTLFDGAFVVDGFARFMKLLTLIASAAASCCPSVVATRCAVSTAADSAFSPEIGPHIP